jgi:hypothetical protein
MIKTFVGSGLKVLCPHLILTDFAGLAPAGVTQKKDDWGISA